VLKVIDAALEPINARWLHITALGRPVVPEV